jgi:hypothetical protein
MLEGREANYLDIFPSYPVDCIVWSTVFIALYSLMPLIFKSFSPIMFDGPYPFKFLFSHLTSSQV